MSQSYVLKQKDSDNEDQPQVPKTNKSTNLTSAQKFGVSAMSKGFFANQQDDELFSPEGQSPTKILQKPKQALDEVESPQRSRRTKTKDAIKLKALGKSEGVEVFKNLEDNQKYHSRRRNKKANTRQDIEKLSEFNDKQSDEQNQEEASVSKKQQFNEETDLAISELEIDETKRKLKDEKDQDIKQIKPRDQQKRQSELSRRSSDESEEISQEENKEKKLPSDNNHDEKSSDDSPQKFLSSSGNLNDQDLLAVLSKPVKEGVCIKMAIQRTTSGFFDLWPQYSVFFQEEKSFLMNGKKVSRTPYSTFVVSGERENFEENSPKYLIKAKSSVMGDQLDIFGPGLNPNNAYDQKVKPRQFLATVIYETRYLQSGQPRNFKVFLKRPETDYYKDFPEIKMYQEEISLNLLYQNEQNRKHIIVLRNRKPEYRQSIKGYMLNFKGRVTVASVKNFILQEEANPEKDIMIFGKYQTDKFHMDVVAPLSPAVGFGIALSCFDSKLFCE